MLIWLCLVLGRIRSRKLRDWRCWRNYRIWLFLIIRYKYWKDLKVLIKLLVWWCMAIRLRGLLRKEKLLFPLSKREAMCTWKMIWMRKNYDNCLLSYYLIYLGYATNEGYLIYYLIYEKTLRNILILIFFICSLFVMNSIARNQYLFCKILLINF